MGVCMVQGEAKPDYLILPKERYHDLESWEYSLEFPPQISIETTNYCNLSCVFCPVPTNQMARRRGHMSMSLVRRIMEECLKHRKLNLLGLSHGGDPLVNPKIVDIIKYIERVGATREIRLTTNAVGLTKKISKELVKLNTLSIVASVNATNRENYKKATGKDYFDLVEKNIETFINLRNEAGKSWPKIVVRMTRLKSAPNEKEFIDKWKNLGDGFSVVEPWTWLGTAGQPRQVYHPILDFPCHLLWSHMVINWDGLVSL
ncbi:MAG: radical SAM protein, partial [Candidatus Hadarchaeum sp.]